MVVGGSRFLLLRFNRYLNKTIIRNAVFKHCVVDTVFCCNLSIFQLLCSFVGSHICLSIAFEMSQIV